MPLWRNTDAAGNSVFMAVQQFGKGANTGNQANLFGNTTADAFVTGITVGQFAVSETEMRSMRGSRSAAKPAHSGYVLRTVGSGGRAGRVTTEVLVAMNTITGDSENTVFQDTYAVITTQPSANSGNSTANETKTFTVVGNTLPTTGGTVSYQWQKLSAGVFANIAASGGFSNVTVATMSVNTAGASVANQDIYRAMVYGTGIATGYSANAILTITS